MPRPDASRQRGSERNRNYLTPRQAQAVIYWSRCPRPRRETRRASRSDARMRWDWWPRAALAGGLDPGSPGDRFQVTVHVEAETFRCREPASAAADTSAETRAIDPPAPEPAAPAADAAAGQAPIEPAVSLHLAAAAHGGGPTAAAPGPDAGQAVIEQAGGIHVGKEAARRVACDAGLVVLLHGPDSDVLDVGRRTRTVPTALRRALEGRDHNQCQFPGCSSRHCDAHVSGYRIVEYEVIEYSPDPIVSAWRARRELSSRSRCALPGAPKKKRPPKGRPPRGQLLPHRQFLKNI